MTEVTREIYAASIPKCCSYRTVERHEEMMLCWGLCRAIEEGRQMDCSGCDLRLPDQPTDAP